MDTQRADPALRSIIVGFVGSPVDDGDPADCLVGINTNIYPDGALCFVLSNAGTYRLSKTTLADTTPLGSIVKPTQGPGAWLIGPGYGDRRTLDVTGTSALIGQTVTTVQNTWAATASGSAFYATGLVSDVFTTDPATGIAQYLGPDGCRFLVSATVSIASATAADLVELGVTQNGALIGLTIFHGPAAAANVPPTTGGLAVSLRSEEVVTLQNGDTLQAVVRDLTGAHVLTTSHLNLVVTPLA